MLDRSWLYRGVVLVNVYGAFLHEFLLKLSPWFEYIFYDGLCMGVFKGFLALGFWNHLFKPNCWIITKFSLMTTDYLKMLVFLLILSQPYLFFSKDFFRKDFCSKANNISDTFQSSTAFISSPI